MRNFYFFLLFIPSLVFSQQEYNWWFFGQNAGVDFTSGVPSPVTGPLNSFEGCSTISDRFGNLLMYSDGSTIWDRTHTPMPNANGSLFGNASSAQSGFISWDDRFPDRALVFTVSAGSTSQNGLRYSVVDMSARNGLGDVVTASKNILLLNDTHEKIAGFSDNFSQRTWVVTFKDSKYYAFEVIDATVQTVPVVSDLPATSFLTDARGMLKFSADGTRLVNTSVDDGAVMSDFDPSTGIVSNPVLLQPSNSNNATSFYGVEFSPDSQLLYADLNSESRGNHCPNGNDKEILQYDLNATNYQNSPFVVYSNLGLSNSRGALQIARNGRIYYAQACTDFLGVIRKPNKLGSSCDFRPFEVQLMTGTTSREGLPQAIISNLAYDYNNIFSKVKMDGDSNGCTPADLPFDLLTIKVSDGSGNDQIRTVSSGNSIHIVPDGTYVIEPQLNNSALWTVQPPSQTVTLNTSNSSHTQNFCVTPNGTVRDMSIQVSPVNLLLPGTNVTYTIKISNLGNVMTAGTVELNYDHTRLTFVSASNNGQNVGSGVIRWSLAGLSPFEFDDQSVTFILNTPMDTPPVNAGDILNFVATVTPNTTDADQSNNTSSLDQTVVNSYDPNDIVCHEGETIAPNQVGERIDYTIRFENNGTAAARNVVVRMDVDPNMFDVSSLIVESASHLQETQLDREGDIEFIFRDINLDFNDATNDGFITYSLKTNPSLAEGDQFSQQAAIYFDYNMPIFTNTYVTTVDSTAGTRNVDQIDFQIYPVPAGDVLNIQSAENLGTIEIFTLSGQSMLRKSVYEASAQLDISELSSGTYILSSKNGETRMNKTFFK